MTSGRTGAGSVSPLVFREVFRYFSGIYISEHRERDIRPKGVKFREDSHPTFLYYNCSISRYFVKNV
jgi:hypothetical protein